ncbi:MAG: hypothetical protein WCL17_05080 [Actinomycetota bacterium]
MRSNVFPELVTGRRDGLEQGRWLVEGGSTRRGQASCNLRDRIIEIPLEDSPTARVVRAHELMHARVSPYFEEHPPALEEVDLQALNVADEFRVNYILGRIGFDTALLRDGTEKAGTKLAAESHDWNEAVCFMLAVLGTGAEKDFFSGIRMGRKEWGAPLRALRKQIYALIDPIETHTISDTAIGEHSLPRGYELTVMPIARLLTRVLQSRAPSNSHEARLFERSLHPGARRAPSGRFAEILWSTPLASKKIREQRPVKNYRASQTGATMRYPSRWVTDTQRRTFAAKTRTGGGIVVIDQSGSMDIDSLELKRLIQAAPGALVIGYSHKPGDRGQTPNAWVLAEGGRVAIDPPSGNIGNGVDGPVLRFAISSRRRGEPIVWVCDGQVTDSNDHPDATLNEEVAQLVRANAIRMVRGLAEVHRALRTSPPTSAAYRQFGRVGVILAKK